MSDRGQAQPEKKSKRLKIPRRAIPEQPAKVRATNFDEVALGYNEDMAKLEASRCLQCKKTKCVLSCPVSIDNPAFIKLIEEGNPDAASAKAVTVEAVALDVPRENLRENAGDDKGAAPKVVATELAD